MIEDLGWLTEGKLAGSGGLIHPVVDETAPTQAQVDEFVALVDEMLDQGQPVLVHCRGGYGRAGTMLACYLVSRGRGAEEAASENEFTRTAADLEPVFDIPVNVSAVLGKTHLEVSQLMQLGPGTIVELDRKVGEAIDIFVNNRLVARGEVVVIDERLGVTMTEIIKGDSV